MEPDTAAGRPCRRCFLTVGGALHPTTDCPELRPGSPAAIVAAEYDAVQRETVTVPLDRHAR